MKDLGLKPAHFVTVFVLGHFTSLNPVFPQPTQTALGCKPSLKLEKQSILPKPSKNNTAHSNQSPIENGIGKANAIAEPKNKQGNHLKKNSDKSGGGGLIPPPPAFQPSYLINPIGSGMPFAIDYMSKQMMLQRLKETEKQMLDAKNTLADKVAQLKEKKEKSERFASLYQEGVVSRRELEAANREAEDASQDMERFQSDMAQLDVENKSLHERLAATKSKSRLVKKHSVKKKNEAIGLKAADQADAADGQ